MLGLNFDLGEDIEMLRDSVWAFAAKEIAPRAAEIDRDNLFPADLWPKFGDMGLLGMSAVSYTHLDVYKRQRPNNTPIRSAALCALPRQALCSTSQRSA